MIKIIEKLQHVQEVKDKNINLTKDLWIHYFKDDANQEITIGNSDYYLGPGFYLFKTSNIAKQFQTNYYKYYELTSIHNMIILDNYKTASINIKELFNLDVSKYRKSYDETSPDYERIFSEHFGVVNPVGVYISHDKDDENIVNASDFLSLFRYNIQAGKINKETFLNFMKKNNIDGIICNDSSSLYVHNRRKNEIIAECVVYNFNILKEKHINLK